MRNGHSLQGAPRAVDLVKHRAYQDELARLLRALTVETIEDGAARLKAAMSDAAAIGLAIHFRRRHGLLVDRHGDPRLYLIGLHQARIRHAAMTAAEKNYSEHWLIRQGLGCDVDALFNPKPETEKEPTS